MAQRDDLRSQLSSFIAERKKTICRCDETSTQKLRFRVNAILKIPTFLILHSPLAHTLELLLSSYFLLLKINIHEIWFVWVSWILRRSFKIASSNPQWESLQYFSSSSSNWFRGFYGIGSLFFFCSCYYCCSPLHLRNGKIWAARIEVHTAENQIKLKIHKEVQRSNINPYKLLFEMFTHLCAFFYMIRQFFSIRETSLTFANTHSTTKPAPTRCASSSAIHFNLIFFVIRFLTRVFADAMSWHFLSRTVHFAIISSSLVRLQQISGSAKQYWRRLNLDLYFHGMYPYQLISSLSVIPAHSTHHFMSLFQLTNWVNKYKHENCVLVKRHYLWSNRVSVQCLRELGLGLVRSLWYIL